MVSHVTKVSAECAKRPVRQSPKIRKGLRACRGWLATRKQLPRNQAGERATQVDAESGNDRHPLSRSCPEKPRVEHPAGYGPISPRYDWLRYRPGHGCPSLLLVGGLFLILQVKGVLRLRVVNRPTSCDSSGHNRVLSG